MTKKIIAILLSLATLLIFAGCGEGKNADIVIKDEQQKTEETVTEEKSINNLTGMPIDKEKADLRPVAIMINNISIAQPVQTGINKADIVYETEVEGGITRLMAVFKDVASVGQIGPIRSARYPYVDMALGNSAVYIHCGQDPTYCAPHLKDIDDISIDTGKCGGTRIKNGLSSEHTLYTYGNKLFDGIKNLKFQTTLKNTTAWQDFAEKDKDVELTDGECTKVTVPFSTSYKTSFSYDAKKGTYTRYFGNTLRTDYITKETIDVKNVFVLMTSISDYSDRYHRQVQLNGGEGYYFSNGKYVKIKWSKGNSANSFKFTDASGSQIKVNAGNSWVCIANTSTSTPVIE